MLLIIVYLLMDAIPNMTVYIQETVAPKLGCYTIPHSELYTERLAK